jgi:4-diphosphocytidyl-2-C-methyl-D-erythritol kinase
LGHGSEVYPIEEAPRKPVLVAIPAEAVSTAGAYQRLSLQLTNQDRASKIPVFCLGYLEGLNGGKGPENDFERIFFEDFPWLRNIKEDWIRCGAEAAGLTGSGSALFAVFRGKEGLLKAVSAAGRKELRLIQTYTLNRLQYQKRIIESLH